MNTDEFLRHFLDSAAVYICVVDRETDCILLVNNYYAKHLGVSKEYMEQHKCWEFVDPDKGRCEFCPRMAESDDLRVTRFFNPTLGIWGEYTAYPVEWIDGRPADIITITDVSNEKILHDKLEQLAYYDRVTGLPNLSKLELDMEDHPGDDYCAIAFGKIDLHDINNRYGRKAGDAILIAVAEWSKNLGLQDTEIYRIDGNAFCMLIRNAAAESTLDLSNLMRERFAKPWELRIGDKNESISADIAICVADGRHGFAAAENLVSKIELTLDRAKSKKRIVVYGENEGEDE